MDMFDDILLHLQPVTDIVVLYFESLGDIFTNTVDQGIGETSYWPKVPDTKILIAALCSILGPVIFLRLFLWCCCSPKRSIGDSNKNRVSSGSKYEALRWYRQAECDLRASINDTKGDTAFEWCCMKCQQAAEKAIKAAMHASGLLETKPSFWGNRKAKSVHHHDICDLAYRLNDPTIKKIAQRLQGATGSSGRMRYPDMLSYPSIPHDVYKEDHAAACMNLTTSLLEHVQDNYLKEIQFWKQSRLAAESEEDEEY